jgi:hypothetical protein
MSLQGTEKLKAFFGEPGEILCVHEGII